MHTGPGIREGDPFHLVTPRTQRDGRMFRPAVLVASALALACVIAVVASSGPARSELVGLARPSGVSEEVPLEMMPDPAEAVTVAQETIGQVDPFHRDGSWIGERKRPACRLPIALLHARRPCPGVC